MSDILSRPIDRLLAPVGAFFAHKLAGAAMLLGAAGLALVWAASPWGDLYRGLLHAQAAISIGEFVVEKAVHHWINDGLIAFFFFVVGLELKREVLAGQLSSPGKAALPIVCALGGMLAPAAIYAAVNAGAATIAGWGVPMATDIAFALGVMALLGNRVSPSVKVFLTAIAVADDLGAIVVIALFYTNGISIIALAIGCALALVAVAMNALGVRSHLAYFLIGSAVWLSFLESGVWSARNTCRRPRRFHHSSTDSTRQPWDGALDREVGAPLRDAAASRGARSARAVRARRAACRWSHSWSCRCLRSPTRV